MVFEKIELMDRMGVTTVGFQFCPINYRFNLWLIHPLF